MGEFKALSFEDLFQGTKALPWGDWIPVDGKFTVVGKSVKSTLHSVPDCQAIVKKAIVEKLKEKYDVDWFDETGAEYTVQVALLKDVATLTIDTSGSGLQGAFGSVLRLGNNTYRSGAYGQKYSSRTQQAFCLRKMGKSAGKTVERGKAQML